MTTQNAQVITLLSGIIDSHASNKAALQRAASLAVKSATKKGNAVERAEAICAQYKEVLDRDRNVRADFGAAVLLMLAGSQKVEITTKERGKAEVSVIMGAADALNKSDRAIEAAAKQVRESCRTPEEQAKIAAAAAKREAARRLKANHASIAPEVLAANDSVGLQAAHIAWLNLELAKPKGNLRAILRRAGFELVEIEIPKPAKAKSTVHVISDAEPS